MGNNHSGPLDFQYNINAVEYAPSCRFEDYLFGEFYEVKHNNNEEKLFLKIRTINDPSKYQSVIEGCYKRTSITHPNLAKIIGFAGRESTTPLNRHYKLYIYFQTLPKDLGKILREHKSVPTQNGQGKPAREYLSEAELMKILYQLVDVLEQLQINGMSHGDIRPESCFVNEKGEILICDRKLLYEDELNYSTPKSSEKNVLFSPLAFQDLTQKKKTGLSNEYKNDVFSVGMTLLECATLKRSAQVYDWGKNPRINMDKLSERLDDVENRYSAKFYHLLCHMLRLDEHLRPDFVRLKRWLTGAEPIGLQNTYRKLQTWTEWTASPKSPLKTIGPHHTQEESPVSLDKSLSPATAEREGFNIRTVIKRWTSFGTKEVTAPVVPLKTEEDELLNYYEDARREVVEFEKNDSPRKIYSMNSNMQSAEKPKKTLTGLLNRSQSAAPTMVLNPDNIRGEAISVEPGCGFSIPFRNNKSTNVKRSAQPNYQLDTEVADVTERVDTEIQGVFDTYNTTRNIKKGRGDVNVQETIHQQPETERKTHSEYQYMNSRTQLDHVDIDDLLENARTKRALRTSILTEVSASPENDNVRWMNMEGDEGSDIKISYGPEQFQKEETIKKAAPTVQIPNKEYLAAHVHELHVRQEKTKASSISSSPMDHVLNAPEYNRIDSASPLFSPDRRNNSISNNMALHRGQDSIYGQNFSEARQYRSIVAESGSSLAESITKVDQNGQQASARGNSQLFKQATPVDYVDYEEFQRIVNHNIDGSATKRKHQPETSISYSVNSEGANKITVESKLAVSHHEFSSVGYEAEKEHAKKAVPVQETYTTSTTQIILDKVEADEIFLRAMKKSQDTYKLLQQGGFTPSVSY